MTFFGQKGEGGIDGRGGVPLPKDAVAAGEGLSVTIYLLDPGLRHMSGHHMHMVLSLKAALAARGQSVRVLGHRGMSADHVESCQAEAVFSVGTYEALSDDPLCGPFETLLAGGPALAADLRDVSPVDGDVLVWLTANPTQVLATSLCLPRWPTRVLTLFVGALPIIGLDAVAWRFAWRRMPGGALKSVAATARMMGQAYVDALNHPVILCPSTHESPVRDRRGAAPVVIGVLGHQRPGKGIQHIEEVVRRAGPEVRWIVQDGGHDAPGVINALSAFANVETLRGPVVDWNGLLSRCDALLMPYDRAPYHGMHSGLVAEALSGGMPMVFPDTPALMEQSEGGGRVAYSGDGPDAMVAAVRDLVERFDENASIALAQSALYRTRNGPERWADWLLQHAAKSLSPGI